MDQATRLRNIIKQNEQRPLARVITVTSGKGGVGKTSLTLNLAIQLQNMGNRVVIVDADFGLANVEVMLGIRPKYNLADMVYKGKKLQEIITEGPVGVGFLSGGSGIQEMIGLDRDRLQMVCQRLYELDELADIILIDTGAGVTDSVLEFVAASSEVLLVVTPEPASITDAYALLKTLNKRGSFHSEETAIRMISNRVESVMQGNRLFYKLSTVANEFLGFDLEYLGFVPRDEYMVKSVYTQNPVTMKYPNSPSSQAILDLATSIKMNSVAAEQKRRGISDFFSKLVRRVSR